MGRGSRCARLHVGALVGDLLELPRRLFLVAHVPLALGYFVAYVHWSRPEIRTVLTHHLGWGLLAAVLVGLFLVWTVLGQPRGARSQGLMLWADVIWLGVVYGLADALLLSVLPVIATWRMCSLLGWTSGTPRRLA